MTKLLRLTLLAAALCAVIVSKADNVANYVQKFDIAFSTDVHDFAVGSGWDHLVDNHNDGFVRYTYHANRGVDNTGCLEIGSQKITDWDAGKDFIVNDLLVTPPVTGKVTVMVKKANSWSDDAGIKFFKVTEAGGKLTRGEEITPAVCNISSTGFSKVELPTLPAGTRVGIRGYYVLIDNVTADAADVTLRRALSIMSVKWNGGKYTDCDADGNYKISYLVRLKNTGDYTLDASTEGYSLALKRNVLNTVVATCALTRELKSGDTCSVSFAATLNQQQYARFDGYLQENITNDSTALPIVVPTAYAPAFKLTGAYGDVALRTGNRIEYGTSRGKVTVNFLLKNRGALPQTLTELSTTPGFAASVQAPLTVAAHDSVPVSVSMTPDVTGQKHGHFTIKGDNNVNLTLNLNGYSVSPDEYFTDVENDSLPEGFCAPDAWRTTNFPQQIYSINNKYCLYCYDRHGASKLVTPLLEVKPGEKLSFEVSKEDNRSYVNLYISTDRHHWTRIDSIGASMMSDSALVQTWTGHYYAFKKIEINNVPAGRWYIAFESGHSYLDNILGFKPVMPQVDAFFDNVNIPATGQVNTSYASSVTLKNTLYKPLPADYKIALYFDGEKVGEAPAATLGAQGKQDVKLSFTPHKAGTYKVFYKFEQGGTVITSDTVAVTIAPETTESETVTGVREWRWEGVPLNLYHYQSESEVIYLAKELKLNPGTQITRLSFDGTSMAAFSPTVTVWLQNTDDTAFAEPYAYTPSEQMTKVYDFYADIRKISETDVNPPHVLELQLAKPFVYTGGNLRVKMKHNCDMGVVVPFDGIGSMTLPKRSIACANDSDLTKATIAVSNVPVMHVGFTATTRMLKGRVTDAATGRGIKNAVVSVTSGDVLYTGTTLDDGTYAVPVIKENLTYQVEVTREGFFPHRTGGVSFATATVEKNVSLKAADGFYIDRMDAPTAAEVNKPYTVTVRATNYLARALAAADYKAQLHFGPSTVKEAATTDVGAQAQGTYTFTLYPHEAGQYKAVVVLKLNAGTQTVSDTVNVTVAEEQTSLLVQVGDSTGTQGNAPVTMNFKRSQTETLYPAPELRLAGGTLIKAISYRGHIMTYSPKSYDARVSVWLANTDEQSYGGTFAEADTTQMTRVFAGTVTYKGTGIDKKTVTLLDIPFSQPFRYEGKSLKVVVISEADDWMTANFVSDNSLTDNSYYRSTDNGKLSEQAWHKAGFGNPSAPVAWLVTDPSCTVSGRITGNAGSGVAGATVTLASGDIVYTGISQADGSFAITVRQPSLTYTATVRAAGYNDATAAVTIGHELNVALSPTTADGISTAEADRKGRVEYFDLNGRRVAVPHAGVYIVREADGKTHKVIVK